MRARHALAIGALLALAGCHDPVTEIVLVVDTDLSAPTEVNQLDLEIDAPAGPTRQQFDLSARGAATFPATVGLVPADAAGFGAIDVTVSLVNTQGGPQALPILRRKASGVRFVRGAVRMLFISLSRTCACVGTSCPNALDAACADVVDPTLAPFDPSHLPRVTPDDGGAPADGGTDAAPDDDAPSTTPDAATDDHPNDARVDAGADRASTDGAKDGPRDAAAEAPPAKLPRGHACVPGDVCQDGFCVDGFCCESACTCGTCNAAPGHCAPTAVGTDPHGDCGAFTCNGAGACETTCPETTFGACSKHCSAAANCDGAGNCVPSTTGAGLHCIVGSCMCTPGLTCPARDGGGAGVCQ
jgi:hypothetical protein